MPKQQKTDLISRFNLTEKQSQAILDMQLRRLAALERLKIEQEYKDIITLIKNLIDILENPDKILQIIKNSLIEIKEKFGDSRRTKIYRRDVDELEEEDLIPNEEVFVVISKQGYIKRINKDTYKLQKRGGTGVKTITTKENDSVRHIFHCYTHDQILFFTNMGKVYSLKVHEIPESSRIAKGLPVINLININNSELITSVLIQSSSGDIVDEDIKQEGEEISEKQGANYKYLLMATKYGIVKKSQLKDFENIRSGGLIAINLNPGDELIWVKPTTGSDKIIIVTSKAKSIFFNESDVRETGRASMGVRGIRLKESDEVISMDVIRRKEDQLLTVSQNGFGKLTKLSSFTVQKRGGSGIFCAKISPRTGKIVVARTIDHPDKDLLILSALGQAVKIPIQDLPTQGRQTSGVKLIRIKNNDDHVAAVAIV